MGVEIFKQTPCGLELGYSNLLFNFVVGTIKHQAIGRPAKVHGGIRLHGLRAPPSRSERTSGQIKDVRWWRTNVRDYQME